jgi:hypothetical protein
MRHGARGNGDADGSGDGDRAEGGGNEPHMR